MSHDETNYWYKVNVETKEVDMCICRDVVDWDETFLVHALDEGTALALAMKFEQGKTTPFAIPCGFCNQNHRALSINGKGTGFKQSEDYWELRACGSIHTMSGRRIDRCPAEKDALLVVIEHNQAICEKEMRRTS